MCWTARWAIGRALVSGQPNLWAVKIDPKAAAETYKARILNDARQRGRPEAAIKVMEEELDSPCTEEMAAFDQFIDYASQDGVGGSGLRYRPDRPHHAPAGTADGLEPSRST